MEDCVFCNFLGEEILFENENFFSVKDIRPFVEGHCLVISKKHFETIFDLPGEFGKDLVDCIKKTSRRIMDKTGSTGLNVVQNNFSSGDQVVNHLHFHLIPRKEGDKVKIASK
jgi:histidine triad (HIT) family protein